MTEQENRKCFRWKAIDLFSTPLNFTYKKDVKYSTRIGGIVTFIYILLILTYLIFEFVYFVKRDKYDLVYLAENMDSTDVLNFKQSKNDFAYRLEYKNNSNSSLTCEDLLDIRIKFIYSARNNTTGKREKDQRDISTYNCKYISRSNEFLKTNESSGIIYKCLDNLNETIRNVYNDNNFSYYEITASLKDSEEDNFTNINDFLLINDCKIELHYLDYTIKVENYNNPIVPYENSVFLQLSPVSILEMNVYFMKQILKEQRNVIFPTVREKTTENTVFSRVEQYSYYKGEDREQRKNQNDIDYKNYAKIFIRADTKKLYVQRYYQSLGRFWADNTQIFWDLFTFCNFFIGVAYNFLSYHSLSKKIFYFHDIDKENNKNFNYHPNDIKLKEIINKIGNDKTEQINKEELNLIDINPKASMNAMNLMRKNSKKKINEENPDNSKNNFNFQASLPQNTNSTINQSSLKSTKDGFYGFLDLYYKCCMRCKNNYPSYLKATKMIIDKLDIVLYVRNTILLDIISKTVIGNERANIVQFLSIPVVSLKDIKNENEKNNIFVGDTNKYRPYLEKDFESCEKEIDFLADKKKKGELDKLDTHLISYIQNQNEELKKLIND